jgi:cell wall-associated NlpC family hydrolase
MAGEAAESVGVETAPGKDVQVVDAANRIAKKASGSVYQMGGKSLTALDCSGYVWLVFKEVFPEFEYLSSEALSKSDMFDKPAEPKPGDIIYFPPSTVTTDANKTKIFPGHVGIVISDTHWIGRQSSKLGPVRLDDRYWWGARPAGRVFLRYKGLKVADLGYLKGRSRLRHA